MIVSVDRFSRVSETRKSDRKPRKFEVVADRFSRVSETRKSDHTPHNSFAVGQQLDSDSDSRGDSAESVTVSATG